MKGKVETTDIRPIVVKADGTVTTTEYTSEEETFFQGWQATTRATEKDKAESRRVGRAIRAAVKQCWFNARKIVLKLPHYAAASYIEGWVVNEEDGVLMEHGWVVRNGKVIDPTLPDRDFAYFAGLEFKGRKGIQEFLNTPLGKKHKNDPFFFAFDWGGYKSPGYMKAYHDAMEYQKRFIKPRP
jgi:hypothetical protein